MEARLSLNKKRELAGKITKLTDDLRNTGREENTVQLGRRKGVVLVPGLGIAVQFNAVEMTLYRLFLAHPEGVAAVDLVLHWKELCRLYQEESWFDEKNLREEKMESLCRESKRVFYSTVSRVKRKFVDAMGPWLAEPFIIKRAEGGIYKTDALLVKTTPSSHTLDSS